MNPEVSSTQYKYDDGVLVSENTREQFLAFEKQYLDVRKKEKRVLTIPEIQNLPFPSKGSSDYQLWKIRRKNILRLIRYLEKRSTLNILDIGCGNGFFTNMLAEHGHHVTGVDINLFELKQAVTAFGEKTKWLCADILADQLPVKDVDVITFCSSYQYFADPIKLIETCFKYLKSGGEIHIIDTPFYSSIQKLSAQENTKQYYEQLGFPEMASYYYHHTLESLHPFKTSFLYKPGIFQKLLNDSPFPWICVKK